jgi:hypothetical protein
MTSGLFDVTSVISVACIPDDLIMASSVISRDTMWTLAPESKRISSDVMSKSSSDDGQVEE